MSTPVTHHSIFHYLNPFVWIRGFCSHLMTCFLYFNRFFVIFFGCFVVIFVVLFFYDRYSNFTYGDHDGRVSHFKVGFFKDTQKYTSPLTQKNNELSKKLNKYYTSKIHQKKISQTDDKQVQQNQENPRADLNPNAAQNQIATKSYQDQWATRPYKSISNEVRRRTAKGRK